MPEIVYVFTNPSMPDIIKIGKTSRDDIQVRLNELYNNHTGVPLPFDCAYKVAVQNADSVEKALHTAFDNDRVNPKREFFRTPPYRVIALLKAFALPDQSGIENEDISSNVSAEEITAVSRANEENTKRSTFRFSTANIRPGSELVYAEDETKKCRVIDDRRVEYEGEQYYLSGLAMKFLNEAGYKTTSVAGTLYFLYENELLNDRRIRLENTITSS